MAYKTGPILIGRWGDQHCWSCDGMKFAPYTDDGADDLICWNCHAINTTANPTPREQPVPLPPIPHRKRKPLRTLGNLGGLIP